jgi:ABC-type transporter Mla subunit MlaD
VGGGEGLRGRGKDLGHLLGSLGPINRGLAKLNTEVAKRKENLANLIHNMNIFWGRIGEDSDGIAQLVDASNSSLGAIASQGTDLARATQLLGPTLQETRVALTETDRLAGVLGPALNSLRPFARKLKPVNESLGLLAKTTRSDVKNNIRPFVRVARQPIRDLRPAAKNLADASPRLTVVGNKLNKLFNMAAYNPKCGLGGCQATLNNDGQDAPGTPNRDEGYLYWLGWLAHVGNSTFQTQDAHGIYRHIYLTLGCNTAASILASTPLAPLITNFGQLFPPSAGSRCP